MARVAKPQILGSPFLAVALLVAGTLLGCSGGESAGPAVGSANPQGITPGKTALDFTLQTLDGTRASLSDYRGQVVLVNFWATWCPPCRAEIPALEAAYKTHRDDGLVILGVSVEDPPELIELFLEDFDITYPILLDRNGAVYRAYRAPGLPTTVLVDRDGIIQVRHIGELSARELDQYLSEVLLSEGSESGK